LFDRPSGRRLALPAIGRDDAAPIPWLWRGGLAAAPDIARGVYLLFLRPVIAAYCAATIVAGPVIRPPPLALKAVRGVRRLEAGSPRDPADLP
jgi:hypothetical protein